MDEEKSYSGSAQALPLEKAFLRFDGPGSDAGKMIPALDVRWCDNDRAFPRYFQLSRDLKIYDRPWLKNGEQIVATCKWLTALPYHKFWSQVVFGDRSLRAMIDTFLSRCPRWHDNDEMNMTFFSRNDKVKTLMRSMYESILLVLVRMATAKGSTPVHYTRMSSVLHGKLIRDYKIFDIPRIMDMCSVYGHWNGPLVERLMEILFTHQPKLYDQLGEVSSSVVKMLSKCENDIERLVGRKLKILRKNTGALEERLADGILRYLLDLTVSICLFAKHCPKALEYYHAAHMTSMIPRFVEQTIGDMLEDLYDRDVHGGFRIQLGIPVGQLNYIQTELVSLWRSIVQHNILDKITNTKTDSKDQMERALQYVDEMLSHLTECLNEKSFLRLYACKYHLSKDMDNWTTHGIIVQDMERIRYICGAMSAAIDAELTEQTVISNEVSEPPPIDNPPAILASDIAKVCELFPDFDSAQAETIIRHYGGDAEAAIDAILSGYLPSECPQLPKESYGKPAELLAPDIEYTDNFVPLRESSKRGAKNVLDDKQAIASSREIYERYQMETEEEEWNALVGVKPLNAALPRSDGWDVCDDDEYDDTYDAVAVDVTDAHADEAAGKIRSTSANRASSDRHVPGGAAASSRPPRGDYAGGRERQNKERHKDHYANHSRKFFATKKQMGFHH